MEKWVLITGVTGFIGEELFRFFRGQGYRIAGVGRNAARIRQRFPDIDMAIAWQELETSVGAMADKPGLIVNLAGDNVGAGRWTVRRRNSILRSRLDSIAALKRARHHFPDDLLLIQASAIGYYGPRTKGPVDESSPVGQGFLAEVVDKAEAALSDWDGRLALMRLGVVLGNDGMLRQLTRTGRFGFIATPGSGKQMLSWIHIDEVPGIIGFLLQQSAQRSLLNAVAPNAVSMRELVRHIARRRRLLALRVPGFVLRLVFGRMADETILADQHVIPGYLADRRYPFQHADAGSAIGAILDRSDGR